MEQRGPLVVSYRVRPTALDVPRPKHGRGYHRPPTESVVEGERVQQTVEAERLLRDVHPVEVSVDGRVLRAARVFVTTDRLVAYIEGRAEMGRRRPQIALSAALTAERPEKRRDSLPGPLTIETDAGPVTLSRGRGCGCGSSLKLLGPLAPW